MMNLWLPRSDRWEPSLTVPVTWANALKMADGTTTEVFYNGATTHELKSPYGLLRLGVENVKPIITRGILIDLADYKGVNTLPSAMKLPWTMYGMHWQSKS